MSNGYIYTEAIHNAAAAEQIVPLLMKSLNPRSVLDVGCGVGTWLSVFHRYGLHDYVGIDGSHIPAGDLRIRGDKFIVEDLAKPWTIHRKFDLVISLEVAEHLPESSADAFVASLVNHGKVILFSAAIPGQGGQFHINEQWPEYWQAKFEKHGFYFHDNIRPLIWDNPKIDWWYRQNIFLITPVKPNPNTNAIFSAVHPQLFQKVVRDNSQYLQSLMEGRQGVSIAVRIFLRALIYKFRKLIDRRK